jgi:hypothetical protein
MGGRCAILNLGSKGQRPSAMDIEIVIQFPDLALPFPPRVTVSHIWIIHEKRKISIKFEVRKSKANSTGH